jgi:hypothetical protein
MLSDGVTDCPLPIYGYGLMFNKEPAKAVAEKKVTLRTLSP